MALRRTLDTTAQFARGLRALAGHDPARAIKLLQTAVESCPATRRAELARRLYWLSLALRRLGKDVLSIKALASAQKLDPRGHARSLYMHMSNGYGMPRSSCVEHDDYRAFCAIHIRRYLETVPERSFVDNEEKEMVLTVIANAWVRMEKSGLVGSDNPAATSCEDKLDLFNDVRIEFPMLRQRKPHSGASPIAVDFRRGTALSSGSRCSCGSGLPYRQCCGRTRTPFEPVNG